MGAPFKGMEDFFVPVSRLKSTVGAVVKTLQPERLQSLVSAVEIEEDRCRFVMEDVSAITFNFQNMEKKSGDATAPFLEMSKAMARGISYAGERDTLTTVLVAALAAGNPDTSFSEIFCPDWENDTVFLSYMGEMNWRLADRKPVLREMDYRCSRTDAPVFVTGRFRP